MTADRYAVGVVGHNVVIDCGTHDAALAYIEQMRAERARIAPLVEAARRTVKVYGTRIAADDPIDALAAALEAHDDQ